MQFAELLHGEHINPKTVLAMRHSPKEPKFRRVLPLLAAERPDLYNAHQQTQAPREEKMLKRAGFLASFIGHEPGKALFIGLYRVDSWRNLKPSQFRVIPAYKELNTKYCQPKRGWTAESVVWFDLELTDFHKEWSRRLVINWPGGFVRITGRELADQKRSGLSRGELTPLGQGGGAVLLEDVAVVEVAVLVEVVVERGMDGSELLKGLHGPELRHRPLSSSERLM